MSVFVERYRGKEVERGKDNKIEREREREKERVKEKERERNTLALCEMENATKRTEK